MPEKKRIVLLGATGSIGDSTLQVLRKYRDHFEIIGIAANASVEKLAEIAKEFEVNYASLTNEEAYGKAKTANIFGETELLCGIEGLQKLAGLAEADIIVLATLGRDGFYPMLSAIEEGKTIALASKEIMVMAGEFFMDLAKKNDVTILPLDSEHNAIFQCLQGHKKKTVEKVYLTASGGAFRNHTKEALKKVTPQEALKHPTWNMGPKVTTDCSTLANKGLELIEAHYLFDLEPERLGVLVHPQSIIHSMIQFKDGAFIAQMSPPHMTFPIQYGLMYPERREAVYPTLGFEETLNLELSPPDTNKFPCLRLAEESMAVGKLAPTIFNAANQVAVDAFLKEKVAFLDIPILIDKTLSTVSNQAADSLETVLKIHDLACKTTKGLIQ